MQKSKKELGLLEKLVELTECNYVSDLTQKEWLPIIRKKVSRINADQYSVNEWMEAIQYITSQRVYLRTQKEAQNYLEHSLKS